MNSEENILFPTQSKKRTFAKMKHIDTRNNQSEREYKHNKQLRVRVVRGQKKFDLIELLTHKRFWQKPSSYTYLSMT